MKKLLASAKLLLIFDENNIKSAKVEIDTKRLLRAPAAAKYHKSTLSFNTF